MYTNDELVMRCTEKMGVTQPEMFLSLCKQWMDFSNPEEIASYRFQRWWKHGELPDFLIKSMKARLGLVDDDHVHP